MTVGKWAHGFTRETRAGKVFVLVAMVRGVRYRKTLAARDEIEAEIEWDKFKHNPEAFKSHLDRARDEKAADELSKARACVLTDEEITRFITHIDKVENYATEYINGVERYLKAWAKVLDGQDIKTVSIKTIDEALTTWAKKKPKANNRRNYDGARAYRIKVLKSWVAYLKTAEGGRRLSEAEDPIKVLKVPQAGPKQAKAYDIPTLIATYSRIKVWNDTVKATDTNKAIGKRTPKPESIQAVRDVFLLAARTGMHLSEIDRLAKGEGTIRVLGPEYGEDFAGTIRFPHKTELDHIVSIDLQCLKAAQRLQERKAAPARSFLRKVLKRARATKYDPIVNCGWLRHSFITNSAGFGKYIMPLNQGVALEHIAQIVGHKSIKMTSSVYNTNQVPPRVSIPSLVLVNTDDPATK